MDKDRPFGKCIVTIKSKEGLRHVENICFRNDIEWCDSGREHIPHRCNSDNRMGISINDDISLASDLTHSCYDTFTKYTVTQFVAKYGKKSKYRIKTKQEFIDEFGGNWRHEVRFVFVSEMDKLFEKELTSAQVKELDEDHTYMASYSICKDMVTTKKSSKKRSTSTITKKVSGILGIKIPNTKLNDRLYKQKKTCLNQNN